MPTPTNKQRAWAEMWRTAAAVCTVALTIFLFLDRTGVLW